MMSCMSTRNTFVLVAFVLAVWGCGEKESPAPTTTLSDAKDAATTKTKAGAFSRDQLIADARQLSDILENAHPDPYINGGGRIAFHRRLQQVLNAIPDEGMTKDEFYRLIRPFVAGVGDAHTNLLGGYEVDFRHPRGVPLRFRVIEQSLVVSGTRDPKQQGLLGARLISVEGVPVEELVERQKRLQGIDNVYHALQKLADQSLQFRPYLLDLVSEWDDARAVRAEIQMPDGGTKELDLPQPASGARWITPKSRVELPVPGDSGFLYTFLRASPTFAPEFESGTDGGYYHPDKVIVLCDAGTLSAGFSVVATFYSLGGILVGTPSAQAPNSYGAAAVFRLNHTGIRGMVPMIAAMHFPDDPSKAHVLPVDYPLTYERLASYDFDPQAEYLYAIELMSAGR